MTDIAAPSDAELNATYAEIAGRLDGREEDGVWREGFARWDRSRRAWRSWANLTRLRYTQDTRRDDYREAQTLLDRRAPAVTALDTAMKQRFLASAARPALEHDLGGQAFALWDADVTTFDPAIAGDLVREAELAREYTELLATASVTFDGEERSLGGLGIYFQDPDRATRHAAERARWAVFEQRADRLDELFDALVRLRDGMARKLGFASYTELGYRRMRRVDYGPDDVARYRAEVERVVVPFAHDLVRRFGAEAGLDRVRFWDEGTLGVSKRVAPLGDRAWIVARTREAFAAIDPELGAFADMLVERDLLDVDNRPGKALGAYCTSFPTRQVPFVFANFNGSRSDVRTLQIGDRLLEPHARIGRDPLDVARVSDVAADGALLRRRRAGVSPRALARRDAVSPVRRGGRPLPASRVRAPDGDAGGAPRDVAGDGATLSAVARLRRPRAAARGGAVAGEASHLRGAVLLHRLHARAVLRAAVLDQGR